ncbi:MAG: hypothetical protein HY726_01110 [Candidatus Rokubacteria bacterium]|nr:hypothetical protein [Candidatus Rokubacteria bacterium]
MSCRVGRRREESLASLTEDQIVTLLELARRRDEVTFKELARCLGVAPDELDEFWTRAVTRTRVSPG